MFTFGMIVMAENEQGTFSLAYSQNESIIGKMDYDHPCANVSNNDTTVNAELAVTLNKRNLFGVYVNKSRIQINMMNKGGHTFAFSNYGKGNYKFVFINN